MGLGWAAQRLGLPTPDIKSVPVLHQAAGTKRKRDDDNNNNMIRTAAKLELSQTSQADPSHHDDPLDKLFEHDSDHGSRSTNFATPPPAKARKTRARANCIRNGGGPTSFFPVEAFDDVGSDTEEDSDVDDEVLLAKYGRQKLQEDTRPIETVFGAGVVVFRSFGGTLRIANPKHQQETMFATPLLRSH